MQALLIGTWEYPFLAGHPLVLYVVFGSIIWFGYFLRSFNFRRELPKLNVFPVLATLPSRVNLKQISAAIFHGLLSLFLSSVRTFSRANVWESSSLGIGREGGFYCNYSRSPLRAWECTTVSHFSRLVHKGTPGHSDDSWWILLWDRWNLMDFYILTNFLKGFLNVL